MPTRSVSVTISGPWPAGAGMSTAELREGLVRPLEVLSPHVGDLGRVFRPKICLLARARHVVCAADHRLHPPEARIPRRADLLLREPAPVSQPDKRIASLVQGERAVAHAGPHDLALVRHVHEEVVDIARA